MKRYFIGILLVSLASIALSGSVGQTRPQTFVSTSGRYRLTVFQLEFQGAIGPSHSDLAGDKTPSNKGAKENAECEATLERWIGRRYEMLWRKPLVNKVSPVSALVSDIDGSFVTFDDWGDPGWGDNVVVVYTSDGDLVKRYSLREIMTPEEYRNFSDHLNYWNGEHRLEYGAQVVVVRVRTNSENDEDKQTFRDVRIQLTDGSLIQ